MRTVARDKGSAGVPQCSVVKSQGALFKGRASSLDFGVKIRQLLLVDESPFVAISPSK